MSATVRAVHPGLRGLVAGPLVAYDLTCHADAVHLGVPSLAATVIIAFDEPLDVGWPDEPGSRRQWMTVGGLHLTPAVVRTHGVQRGIQLSLTPLGCRTLLHVPLAAIAHHTVDSIRLPGPLDEHLHDELAGLPTADARLRHLEARLLERRTPDSVRPEVQHAWHLLSRNTSVRETAAAVGWSERHLTTQLRAETGLRPKQVSRLGRFGRARALVRGGMPLADAACTSGYADQAHLSREWSAFAGQSPSREAEFVFLHDDGSVRPAPSQT